MWLLTFFRLFVSGLIQKRLTMNIVFVLFSGLHGEHVRCWSYIGHQKRGQFISLNKDGCLSRRTVQHEVLHALGFNHEQVRSDRDRYVLIYHQNIKSGNEHNFQKKVTNNLGTPYDFQSVMQYGKYAFSKNGLPTIVAKSDSKWDWGRATEMSVNDIARVNKLYKCSEY
uniref:Metalloendopeptidase n=1 Tax=Xiphophorus couchianus TaxID=32473 RepID=A0A3B5KZF5_9TELE